MFQLTAKKSLGQHFLVDPKIHHRIVEAFAPTATDTVIEIGPGTGLLTRELLARSLKKVIAYELDSRAIPELTSQFHFEGARFTLIEQNFLDTDLNALSSLEGEKLRVIGNIPYYITSPIIFKLIDERKSLLDAVLLVQKEVAERLTAEPRTKEYGIPTVLANFFGEVKYLFTVPAGAFRPVPKVDSALIRIDFAHDYYTRIGTNTPPNFRETAFRTLVRSLFSMRRKTVRNNLKTIVASERISMLETSGYAALLSARAEELALADFLKLFYMLYGKEYEGMTH